jgi:hypothetical protein
MALRKVVKVKKYKIFRGQLLLGYGADLLLECGHVTYRKGSMVCKTAHCNKCSKREIQ